MRSHLLRVRTSCFWFKNLPASPPLPFFVHLISLFSTKRNSPWRQQTCGKKMKNSRQKQLFTQANHFHSCLIFSPALRFTLVKKQLAFFVERFPLFSLSIPSSLRGVIKRGKERLAREKGRRRQHLQDIG